MESGASWGLGLRELCTMSSQTLVMQIVESEKFCSALIGACDCVGLCVCVWTQHVACTYPTPCHEYWWYLVCSAALKTTVEDKPSSQSTSKPVEEVASCQPALISTGSSDTGVTSDMSVSHVTPSLVSHVSPKPSGLGLLGSYSSDSDNDSTHSWMLLHVINILCMHIHI